MKIGPDGTLEIDIDTAAAKELHGDSDHRYEITAEVVDASRRTIVGTGSVLVARKPFKIFSWVNRGYYRVGDTIEANFSAQTLDQKPVEGAGELKLLRITYDKNQKPVEQVVQTWKLDTDAEGQAKQKIDATRAGQYRLSYKLTDAAKHTIEGGYLFTITGQGFTGAQFQYSNLELIARDKEYKPGSTLDLMINTNRTDSTVLLFVRPQNGTYLPPKVLRMRGKSVVEEIAIVKKDMPNFFIEAITVADGQVHTQVKQIVVPPERRVVDVEVLPSSDTYKPGEKAKVKLKVTGLDGQPLANSSTVMAVYDKAVEYISGGSNVGDIKSFFWNWKRNHHPQTEHNLAHYFHNLVSRGKASMANLGVFGETVVDEISAGEDGDRVAKNDITRNGTRFDSRGGGGFGGGVMAKSEAAPAADVARGAPHRCRVF